MTGLLGFLQATFNCETSGTCKKQYFRWSIDTMQDLFVVYCYLASEARRNFFVTSLEFQYESLSDWLLPNMAGTLIMRISSQLIGRRGSFQEKF